MRASQDHLCEYRRSWVHDMGKAGQNKFSEGESYRDAGTQLCTLYEFVDE